MAQIKILNTKDLEVALGNMGLPVAFSRLDISPSSILYHFNLINPLDYMKVKKIATCLSAEIRKPIRVEKSEHASFCLSTPRETRAFPTFRQYHHVLENKPAGEILFGINEKGEPITRNIRDTKSMLVGGASGGGKSVYLSNILSSLICYSKPEECGIILIDLKRCEFATFENSTHLVAPVQYEYEGAYKVLCDVKKEIEKRYKSMQLHGIRKATVDKYPLLLTFIDEYAELASHSNKNELDKIVSSIASTGRACNVFIIVATQHAISSIISNTIKSNLQTRIGLRTTNLAQSVCIINTRDCVDLLGYGDSFISFDGVAGLQRVQGCYVDENDINKMIDNNVKQEPTKPTFWQWLKSLFKSDKPKGVKIAPTSDEKPFNIDELNDLDCILESN